MKVIWFLVFVVALAGALYADVTYTPIDATTIQKVTTDVKTINVEDLKRRREELVNSKVYWTNGYLFQIAEFDKEIASIDATLAQFTK